MQKKPENSPAPDPERAIYGFFLQILSIVAFILFVILSYLPVKWLNEVGLTYLPEKYWYVAVPSYLVVIPFVILAVYTTLNMRMVNDFNSVNSLKDRYSIHNENDQRPQADIPAISDIPLIKMCEILYLDSKKKSA